MCQSEGSMFTGIVQGMASVVALEKKPGLYTFSLVCDESFLHGLITGASVSVAGVCLSVTAIKDQSISFDVMGETLKKTTLCDLVVGERLNVERSYKVGDEIGGHVLSGHVTGVATIIDVDTPENNHLLTIEVDPELMDYFMPKGFVAVDGVSLTVIDVDKEQNTFSVGLIPETLARTTFGSKKEGSHVNIEIDSRTQAIVDTMKTYLQDYPHDTL